MNEHKHLTIEELQEMMSRVRILKDIITAMEPYRMCEQCLDTILNYARPKAVKFAEENPKGARELYDNIQKEIANNEAERN